jgi:hypothetical protein
MIAASPLLATIFRRNAHMGEKIPTTKRRKIRIERSTYCQRQYRQWRKGCFIGLGAIVSTMAKMNRGEMKLKPAY